MENEKKHNVQLNITRGMIQLHIYSTKYNLQLLQLSLFRNLKLYFTHKSFWKLSRNNNHAV